MSTSIIFDLCFCFECAPDATLTNVVIHRFKARITKFKPRRDDGGGVRLLLLTIIEIIRSKLLSFQQRFHKLVENSRLKRPLVAINCAPQKAIRKPSRVL